MDNLSTFRASRRATLFYPLHWLSWLRWPPSTSGSGHSNRAELVLFALVNVLIGPSSSVRGVHGPADGAGLSISSSSSGSAPHPASSISHRRSASQRAESAAASSRSAASSALVARFDVFLPMAPLKTQVRVSRRRRSLSSAR